MSLERTLIERQSLLGFAVFEIKIAQHFDGVAVAGMSGKGAFDFAVSGLALTLADAHARRHQMFGRLFLRRQRVQILAARVGAKCLVWCHGGQKNSRKNKNARRVRSGRN